LLSIFWDLRYYNDNQNKSIFRAEELPKKTVSISSRWFSGGVKSFRKAHMKPSSATKEKWQVSETGTGKDRMDEKRPVAC
jgi:hypothetical protein